MFSEKYGFSVVAPISVTVPSSTAGSSTSCCAFDHRCTSSTNRTVLNRPPRAPVHHLARVADAAVHRGELHEVAHRRHRPAGRRGSSCRTRPAPTGSARAARPSRSASSAPVRVRRGASARRTPPASADASGRRGERRPRPQSYRTMFLGRIRKSTRTCPGFGAHGSWSYRRLNESMCSSASGPVTRSSTTPSTEIHR